MKKAPRLVLIFSVEESYSFCVLDYILGQLRNERTKFNEYLLLYGWQTIVVTAVSHFSDLPERQTGSSALGVSFRNYKTIFL